MSTNAAGRHRVLIYRVEQVCEILLRYSYMKMLGTESKECLDGVLKAIDRHTSERRWLSAEFGRRRHLVANEAQPLDEMRRKRRGHDASDPRPNRLASAYVA